MIKKLTVYGFLLLGVIFQLNAAVVQDKNGLEITEQDINVLLEKGTPAAQRQLIESRDKFKTKIEEVYLTKAIAANARKEGLADSAEQQVRLQAMIDEFYFRLKLKSLKTDSLPDFEPLAKLRYETNQQAYFFPEQVDVAHILIDYKKRTKKQALQLAKEIKAKLLKGDDFAELAKKYSDDTTAKKNQGELGLYPGGVMPNQFDQVAFAMKVGEISDPVETKYGYHIIKLNGHEAKKYKTYQEAKDEIINEIKEQYIKSRVDDYFKQVKTDHKMQINEQELIQFSENKLSQIKEPEASKEKKGEEAAK